MQAMIGYFMETAGLEELIDNITDTLALSGELGLQPRWNYCYGMAKLPDLTIAVINGADVGVYPVTEPIDRTVLMVRTYLTKQELIDMAAGDPSQSFSIEAIRSLKQEEVFSRPTTANNSSTDTFNKRLGIEVIDYYAPMVKVEDQEFYHARWTVAQGKTLIRFVSKDNPNASTQRGTSYVCLKELYVAGIGPVRVGVGLCNKAYDHEMAAITVQNLGIDNVKDTTKPPRTYDPQDKYWNKNRSGFLPGELVPSSSTNPRHLMPLDQSARNVPQSEEMISRLMYQFEASVGMPNFLSGTSDTDDRRVSATAKRIEANGADTGLRKYAKSINSRGLRPLTIDVYEMIRTALTGELERLMQLGQVYQAQGIQISPDLINKAIGQMPFLSQAKAICPDFDDWLQSGQGIPPISSVRCDLSTFEDALQKVDMINSTERALGTLLPIGQAAPELATSLKAQINFDTLTRGYMNSLDLGNTLNPLSQVSETMKQAQQASEQEKQKNDALQATQVQLEAAKVQAEIAKLTAEAQKAQAEIEKTQAETQKIQAEALQTLDETNNPKEKADDSKPKTTKS
jgi:hypothetical protein